jgi:hypothetical protein
LAADEKRLTMGANIRTRLGLGHPEDSERSELTDTDVQSALGRLSAYDPEPERRERRRPPSTTPVLRARAGLWRR